MIQGLFETHLFVENLDISISFYKSVLGLSLCHYEEERRAAFFWIGKPKEAMLGLWEKQAHEIQKRHFAFRVTKEFLLKDSIAFLKSNHIKPYNFFKDETESPMVFAWMPAVAIYFNDPDENNLEFIAPLEGKGKPELGVISYEQWLQQR